MENKESECVSPVCFYMPMNKSQLDEINFIDDTGRLFVDGDWSDALECLENASVEFDAVTLLFGDPGSDGNARWIAVIHDVDVQDEGVEITVHCLRELPHPFPAPWLRRLGSTESLAELNAGDAALCNSPVIVAQYLVENGITSNYVPHPFLFNQCVMVLETPDELAEAQPFDQVHCALKPKGRWKFIEDLLLQASAEEKLLLAAFSDPQDKEYLGWVTTIDDAKVDGDRAEMRCFLLCDFRQAEPRIPLSVVNRFGHVALSDDVASRDFEICAPSWLMNDCLSLLNATTTVEAFIDALKAANLSAKQVAMLSYHYRAPNHTISMGRLAESMGYKNFNAANLHYGKLAARVGKLLGLGEDEYGDNINILAEPSSEKNDAGHFQWEMKAELVAALEKLGLVKA